MDPEMSPREARRLETRVRREWEREKRDWNEDDVVVGMGKEQVVVVRRRRSVIIKGVMVNFVGVLMAAMVLC